MPRMLGKDGMDARLLGMPWILCMVWMGMGAMDVRDIVDAWDA